MTGWQKVAALTALYVVGLLWVNWTMVRRVRHARAVRAAWSAEDFDAVFTDCDPRVAPVVRAVVAPLYGEGVVPMPEDTLTRFLKLDNGEIEDLAMEVVRRLDPAAVAGTRVVPALPDVAALVRYVDGRLAA